MPEPVDERLLELPADLNYLPQVQELVEEACEAAGFPAALSFKLTMAADELFTNIAMHAAADLPQDACVTISVKRPTTGTVVVELSDPGLPFDPLSHTAEAVGAGAIEDRPVGGLGLHLVRSMVHEVAYSRRGGRNVVRLAMHRDGPQAAS